MDVHATLEAPCNADDLFAFVDDLGCYPRWIDLVHAAVEQDGDVESARRLFRRAADLATNRPERDRLLMLAARHTS